MVLLLLFPPSGTGLETLVTQDTAAGAEQEPSGWESQSWFCHILARVTPGKLLNLPTPHFLDGSHLSRVAVFQGL